VIGSTLLFLTGAIYLAILQEESANPRRNFLARLWPDVALNTSLAQAIHLMGPPDAERETWELVPACAELDRSAASKPCTVNYACVREYSWYSWQDTQSGAAYSLCADAEGVVRKKTKGWAFRLVTW
jgi:hypothetical protein